MLPILAIATLCSAQQFVGSQPTDQYDAALPFGQSSLVIDATDSTPSVVININNDGSDVSFDGVSSTSPWDNYQQVGRATPPNAWSSSASSTPVVAAYQSAGRNFANTYTQSAGRNFANTYTSPNTFAGLNFQHQSGTLPTYSSPVSTYSSFPSAPTSIYSPTSSFSAPTSTYSGPTTTFPGPTTTFSGPTTTFSPPTTYSASYSARAGPTFAYSGVPSASGTTVSYPPATYLGLHSQTGVISSSSSLHPTSWSTSSSTFSHILPSTTSYVSGSRTFPRSSTMSTIASSYRPTGAPAFPGTDSLLQGGRGLVGSSSVQVGGGQFSTSGYVAGSNVALTGKDQAICNPCLFYGSVYREGSTGEEPFTRSVVLA